MLGRNFKILCRIDRLMPEGYGIKPQRKIGTAVGHQIAENTAHPHRGICLQHHFHLAPVAYVARNVMSTAIPIFHSEERADWPCNAHTQFPAHPVTFGQRRYWN